LLFNGCVGSGDSAMVEKVALGPVSVVLSAAKLTNYQSGVYNGPCGTTLDHAAVVVGYTAEYWLVLVSVTAL
jgi:hypothetical protein